ncbi:hypothetical protein RJT34_00690 [Clitoria ternatea]|uniref:Uncharacterized protein n=1 Tax=Clitoria ternatea TaxID=43366 RepID=A0AAN9KJJ7_CLITE
MEKESREEKRARVEKRIRGILFMEMDGELMGIDLNQHQSWDCKGTSPPPTLSFNYRVDHNFPFFMRPFKLDGKLYLAGGYERPKGEICFTATTNRVYEFDPDAIVSANDNELVTVPGHRVLMPAPSLKRPKRVIVADLRGTIYVLHHWDGPLYSYEFPDDKYDVLFEYFDPTHTSWHQAPTPPFYQNYFQDNDHIFQDKVDDWPLSVEMCPVICYYVVDDKLFVLCNDNLIYAFSHSSKQWEVITPDVNLFRVYGRHISSLCTGLWLPEQQIALVIDCPMLSSPGEPWFFQADAIIYSPDGVPEFHQVLEEVFSDMYPHDSKYSKSATTHLLHLGQGSQEDQTRICAVMFTVIGTEWTIDPKMGDQQLVCLFISIFDLQRLHPSHHVPANSCQLLKVSPVKKLLFKLNDVCLPPLNTFII